MFFPLLLLFTCVPIVELALLIEVGRSVGVGPTIALVLVTGILGAGLARREGFKTWMAIQRKSQAGELPSDELVEGVMILIAGLVLITPGLITDALGFAMLIPPVRKILQRRVSAYVGRHMVIMTPGMSQTPYDIVDEQDATEVNGPQDHRGTLPGDTEPP